MAGVEDAVIYARAFAGPAPLPAQAMRSNVVNDEYINRDYGFPGTPYPQQKQLMDALYDAMERGAVGLFESPTGTGKTLSIICAISTFLRDQRRADASPPA
eukprot:IDg4415t1